MGILGKVFTEISKPVDVLKRTFKERKDSYSGLKNDFNHLTNKEVQVEKLPVAKSTTKHEFKSRFENLYLNQVIIGIFFVYSLYFSLVSDGFMNVLTSLSLSGFFLVAYVTMCYKNYLARLYFQNWENRFERVDFPIKKFIAMSFSNLRILMPNKDIKKL
jgi:hypothetical protein